MLCSGAPGPQTLRFKLLEARNLEVYGRPGFDSPHSTKLENLLLSFRNRMQDVRRNGSMPFFNFQSNMSVAASSVAATTQPLLVFQISSCIRTHHPAKTARHLDVDSNSWRFDPFENQQDEVLGTPGFDFPHSTTEQMLLYFDRLHRTINTGAGDTHVRTANFSYL
ncbi:hypothetical protein B0H10DRAFT_1939162 [Mycena sp. CBHHK59/15]|nr:hypothetical protein B0H10DRAFT_1939162 [Mycena sp. CBHHK59/15]